MLKNVPRFWGLAVVLVLHSVDVLGTDINAPVLVTNVSADQNLCRRLMFASVKVGWKQKAIWAPLSDRRSVLLRGMAHSIKTS